MTFCQLRHVVIDSTKIRISIWTFSLLPTINSFFLIFTHFSPLVSYYKIIKHFWNQMLQVYIWRYCLQNISHFCISISVFSVDVLAVEYKELEHQQVWYFPWWPRIFKGPYKKVVIMIIFLQIWMDKRLLMLKILYIGYCIEYSMMNFIFSLVVLTLNVRGPSYLGLTRSISWLLMPWLLTSPGHQQPWYLLYRMLVLILLEEVFWGPVSYQCWGMT